MLILFKNVPTCVISSSLISRTFPLTGVFARGYAADAKKAAKLATPALIQKEDFPLEKDPNKLVEYCCGSNLYKEGEDMKLKPENEYPDWLYEIRTNGPPTLEELDPSTKEYWELVNKIGAEREERVRKKELDIYWIRRQRRNVKGPDDDQRKEY